MHRHIVTVYWEELSMQIMSGNRRYNKQIRCLCDRSVQMRQTLDVTVYEVLYIFFICVGSSEMEKCKS